MGPNTSRAVYFSNPLSLTLPKKEESSLGSGRTVFENERCKVENWNGKGKPSFFAEIIEEVLIPETDRKIYLTVPHGEHAFGSFCPWFNIYIWSACVGIKEGGDQIAEFDPAPALDMPETIWGIPVDCRSWVFAPSGQGIPIRDDDYTVAELVDYNLFIHHDICHCGTENELMIFRKVLEEVVKILPEVKEQQRQMAEKRKTDELAKNRDRYIQVCSSRLRLNENQLRKEVNSSRNLIADLERKLVVEHRKWRENSLLLEFHESGNRSSLAQFGQEFDKLTALSKVIDVKLTGDQISVYTDTLFCVNPSDGEVYEIGKFRIEIFTDGQKNGVRFFNLTNQVRGYQAPHVNSEGKACLGNMSEVIPELIANYEYSALAMIAIQFIESYNSDEGGYCRLHNWPLAKRSE